MGKTLMFWLPLLFLPNGVQIVVTPLNILGQQNVETLRKVGVEGIFIPSSDATCMNYQVCLLLRVCDHCSAITQAMLSFKYRVIVVNPEALMKPGGIFEELFKNKIFMSSVISLIIDEVHCISQWGTFRPKYRELGRLRHLQRYPCTIMATSATMTPSIITDIKTVLGLREENLFVSRCSIDRPNINIIVRAFRNPRNTFSDLKFLLRDWQPGLPPPPTFIVFFDSIPESIEAALYLRGLLPAEYEDRIKWFNSDMSDRFKGRETVNLADGEIWGLMATDSFGMVYYTSFIYVLLLNTRVGYGFTEDNDHRQLGHFVLLVNNLAALRSLCT